MTSKQQPRSEALEQFDKDEEKWWDINKHMKIAEEATEHRQRLDKAAVKNRLIILEKIYGSLIEDIRKAPATDHRKKMFIEYLERNLHGLSDLTAAHFRETIELTHPKPYGQRLEPKFEDQEPTFYEKIYSHAIGRDYLDRYLNKKTDERLEDQVNEINGLISASQEKVYFWRDQAKHLGALELLAFECPNFAHVVEKIKESLLLAKFEETDRPKPILMVSPPGCGKSYFAQRMADYLGLPMVDFDLSAMDSAFNMIGSSSSFNRSGYSRITRAVAEWNCDSGILFFDEVTAIVDEGDRNYPVKPALLGILDVEQSKRFRDAFFEVKIDISRWFKLAACNDLSGLSSALLDRFEVVHIKPPTREERVKIVASICAKTSFQFTEGHFEQLAVASGSSRKLQGWVRQACINAARRGSNEVADMDIRRLMIKGSFEV